MFINGILVVGIIVSFVWYLYFKTKQIRTYLPIRKKWYAARSSVCLGAFIALFGVNFLYIYQSGITVIVSAIFIILGVYFMYHNWKAAKHYGKFVQEELELNQ